MIIFLLSLILAANTTAGCCNTWIRGHQTAKSDTISMFSACDTINTAPIITATAPSQIKHLQIDLEIMPQLYYNDDTLTSTCNPMCGYFCQYSYKIVIFIDRSSNYQLTFGYMADETTVARIEEFGNLPNFNQILFAQTGFLTTQKETFSWSSISDAFYSTYYPDGIELNNGESITVSFLLSDCTCCQPRFREAPPVRVLGTSNFIYRYSTKYGNLD